MLTANAHLKVGGRLWGRIVKKLRQSFVIRKLIVLTAISNVIKDKSANFKAAKTRANAEPEPEPEPELRAEEDAKTLTKEITKTELSTQEMP